MDIKPLASPARRVTFAKSKMFVLCSLATIAIFGCGTEPSYPNAHLAGAVSVDGHPIQEGSIAFTPIGSTKGPAVGSKITAGRYDCPHVPLGELLMQIYASRSTGKTIEVMGTTLPEVQDLVPEKDRDGIKIEVTGDNLNQDIALNSSHNAR
jgi:hypothetical protein